MQLSEDLDAADAALASAARGQAGGGASAFGAGAGDDAGLLMQDPERLAQLLGIDDDEGGDDEGEDTADAAAATRAERATPGPRQLG
jgi:hypothetical protein